MSLLMAKIHPSSSSSSSTPPLPSQPSSSNYLSSKIETFTIWMKSLILNGKGCTVYDSDGRIAYRVDNYNNKCKKEIYVMDAHGIAVLKILKKKLRLLERWEGYRCSSSQKEEVPWFKIKKPCRILKGEHLSCEILAHASYSMHYKIVGLPSKSTYKIVDITDKLVAEVKRKQTASGVALGDDVLSLDVEPNIDQSLIMGIVVVHGLINHDI